MTKKYCKSGENIRMDVHGMRANMDNLKDEIMKLNEYKKQLGWGYKEDFEIQFHYVLEEFDNVLGCNESFIKALEKIDSEK